LATIEAGRCAAGFRFAYVSSGSLLLFQTCNRMSVTAPIAAVTADIEFVGEAPCVDGSELARETSRRMLVGAAMCSACLCDRGSGLGQKHAFEHAVARVGCPDRRVDRLCITCCLPSQPSHHAEVGAISSTPQVPRALCSAGPWPSWPTPFWRSCWRVRRRQPWWTALPAMR
jgi:hypothetical protein